MSLSSALLVILPLPPPVFQFWRTALLLISNKKFLTLGLDQIYIIDNLYIAQILLVATLIEVYRKTQLSLWFQI